MNRYMKQASEEAEKGMKADDGGPFGAAIVRKGKIVALGHNEALKTNDPTNHAEMVAIRKATKLLKRFDISDCELYTTCEPCPMCLGAIYWSGIQKIYYAATRQDAASIDFRDKEIYDFLAGKKVKNPLTLKQMDRKECIALFKEWKRKEDKRMY